MRKFLMMTQYLMGHYSLIAHWARSVAAKVVFITELQSYWYLVAAGADRECILWPHRRPFLPIVMSWCRNPDISMFVFTQYYFILNYWTNINIIDDVLVSWADIYSIIWIPRLYIPKLSLRVSFARGASWPGWHIFTQNHFLLTDLLLCYF